jgi:hypothetical protein
VDSHANFAYSTVASAPSPATSGTSLTVQAGAGGLFATPPTNLVVWPAGVVPLSSNAEIVRLTAKVGDVFTITRAQEGTTAQAIAAGYQLADAFTTNLIADMLDEVAQVGISNTFTADQTVNGDLYVTGEINPARVAAQRTKINQLIGPGSGRTLLSTDLVAGMSLRYDESATSGKITVGNYDTQTYQPLAIEADHISLTTGTFPPGMEEHLRVHPSGGVTVGEGVEHDTDPGVGIVRARGLDVPLSAAERLWGRGASGVGPVEELTLGPNLYMEGTTLKVRTSSTTLLQYDWNSTTVPPPTSSQIRIDAAPPYTTATTLWVRPITTDGIDASRPLVELQPDTRLLVQDKNDSTLYIDLVTTGPTVSQTGYFEIPVRWLANGGALVSNQACLLAVGQRQQTPATLPALSLVGRGDSGAGAAETITLGTGLSFEGTVLTATAKNSGVYGYAFATQLTAPPSAQSVRINAGHPYTAATKVFVTFLNTNGEDLYYGWMRTPVGSTLLIQNKANHLLFAEFTLTAAPLDKGAYAELPVTWKANGTALTAQACLVRTTEPVVTATQWAERVSALEARVAVLEKRLTRRL